MTTREVLKTIKHEEGIEILNSKKSDKEVYDILVSKGLTDSFDTFASEIKAFAKDNLSKMSKDEILKQLEGAELTDEELAQIAGGKGGGSNENQGINEREIVALAVAAGI